jgi:hypothetical protein
MGALSQSSDQSNGVMVEAPESLTGSPQRHGTDAKATKAKKLKKYKNNAEKVFSLFSSPRQQPST